MNKKILTAAIVIAMTATLPSVQAETGTTGYQLQQVLIMSRHNLRAPLANGGSILAQSTAQQWPEWEVPGGQLTTKGGILEVYMGHYFQEWLAEQGMVKKGECPAASSVYAYANSLQRTVATAQFFITGAFPGCDVPVHHQDKMGTMDPTFNPVITDDSPEFRAKAVQAMENARKEMLLDSSYQLLEKITRYSDSPLCKEEKRCTLTATDDSFSAEPGKEPGVKGSLKTGNALVDAFTLQYYEGFPVKDVAWGEIKSDSQWRVLSKLKNGYQDSLFSPKEVARNVASPLVKYITQALVTDAGKSPAITLLVGHDSNIASLISALDFQPYQLHDQYERTPIGGKIVFQRWYDSRSQRNLMKIEYVYQSTAQLRHGTPLTLSSPPQRVTLALKGCPVDGAGFCPLEQFNALMKDLTK